MNHIVKIILFVGIFIFVFSACSNNKYKLLSKDDIIAISNNLIKAEDISLIPNEYYKFTKELLSDPYHRIGWAYRDDIAASSFGIENIPEKANIYYFQNIPSSQNNYYSSFSIEYDNASDFNRQVHEIKQINGIKKVPNPLFSTSGGKQKLVNKYSFIDISNYKDGGYAVKERRVYTHTNFRILTFQLEGYNIIEKKKSHKFIIALIATQNKKANVPSLKEITKNHEIKYYQFGEIITNLESFWRIKEIKKYLGTEYFFKGRSKINYEKSTVLYFYPYEHTKHKNSKKYIDFMIVAVIEKDGTTLIEINSEEITTEFDDELQKKGYSVQTISEYEKIYTAPPNSKLSNFQYSNRWDGVTLSVEVKAPN